MNNEQTQTETVAQILMAQIGRRAFVMLGAKGFVALPDGLQFGFKGRSAGRGTMNKIVVKLAADDTYTVQFWYCRGVTMRLIAEDAGVYVDSLHRMIESRTGLYLSLYPKAARAS